MKSTLFALDFDGVLCNGLIEYFQTAWRAYCQVWSPSVITPPRGSRSQFLSLASGGGNGLGNAGCSAIAPVGLF